MTNDASPEAKPYHHGDLRDALLRAGESLLEEHGAASLSLRAVAKLAGVSHAAPYRHFRDKNALLEALAAEGFEKLKASVDGVMAKFPGEPKRQLIAVGAAYARQAVERPQRTHLMFGGFLEHGGADSHLQQAAEASFASLLDLVKSSDEAGIFRQVPRREIVLTLWSAVHGLAMLRLARQLRPLEMSDDIGELWQIVGGHLLKGLLRDPEPGQ